MPLALSMPRMKAAILCENVKAATPWQAGAIYSQHASRMNDRGMKIEFFMCAFLSLIG